MELTAYLFPPTTPNVAPHSTISQKLESNLFQLTAQRIEMQTLFRAKTAAQLNKQISSDSVKWKSTRNIRNDNDSENEFVHIL